MFFTQLDPRIRLLWWASVSILVINLARMELIIVVMCFMYIGWHSANMTKQLWRYTISITPFTLFIGLMTIYPHFDLDYTVRMMLRFYTMFGATTLTLITLTYGELTNAIRNMYHPRLSFLERPLEIFSFMFGIAFLAIPLAKEEWEKIKEVQKARGVDITQGSRFKRTRAGIAMFQPLALRMLEGRMKHFILAAIMYGYSPFEKHTQYSQPTLSYRDKQVMLIIFLFTVTILTITFSFKV